MPGACMAAVQLCPGILSRPASTPSCPTLLPTYGVHLSMRRLPVGTRGWVARVALVTARAMPEANAMAPGAAILTHRRAGTPYVCVLARSCCARAFARC